jgi:hypothetical protein
MNELERLLWAGINPESEWILDEVETDKGCGHCTSDCNDDYCVKGDKS